MPPVNPNATGLSAAEVLKTLAETEAAAEIANMAGPAQAAMLAKLEKALTGQ